MSAVTLTPQLPKKNTWLGFEMPSWFPELPEVAPPWTEVVDKVERLSKTVNEVKKVVGGEPAKASQK